MNPWKGLKNLPHNMWIIFFTTLINRTGTMVLPFLTLYLTSKEGLSAGDAGLVIAFYGAGALVTAPLSGRLSDKIGPLRMMKISLITTGLFLFVYSLVNQYYLILVVTFFLAIINESFRPANLSIISQVVPQKQRRSAFALNRLAINLGMSIGPVIGGILTLINFSLIFYIDGLTSIFAGIFLIFAKWQPVRVETGTDHSKTIIDEIVHSHVLKDKRYIFFLLSILPVPLIYFQHLGAFPLFLVHDLGFATSVYGFVFAINTIMIIFIEVPLNNLMNDWNEKKSLALGALLTGIGFGAMALASNLTLIIITTVVWTFGEMIFFPVSASHVSGLAPEKKRGEYMGYFQMMFSIAFLLGPWAGTLVFEFYGSAVLWTAAFILGLTSALILMNSEKK
ncbi:MAG: MFS transporter [Ignavibacteriaceae bacterium]